MSGIDKPNYTQTPNILFDVLMADMGEAELKVVLAIVRQTLGYHKKRDPISLSQLQKLTGLSRTACSNGADYAIKRGIVARVSRGKRGVSVYELVVKSEVDADSTSSQKLLVAEIDQSTKATSSNSPALLDEALTSSLGLPTKESNKENTQKKTRGRARGAGKVSQSEYLRQENLAKYDDTIRALLKKFKPDVDWAMVRPCDMYAKEIDRYIEAAQIYSGFGLTADDLPGMFKYLDAKGWPSYGVGKIAECAPDYAGYKAKRATKIIPDDPAMDLSIPQTVTPILMEREKIAPAELESAS